VINTPHGSRGDYASRRIGATFRGHEGSARLDTDSYFDEELRFCCTWCEHSYGRHGTFGLDTP